LNYGAWFRDTISSVNYGGTVTGLRVNGSWPITIKLKDLGDILKTIFDKEGQIDLVKVDCEGCEYSLLKLDKETIKLSRQYIIEIHGS
jgi:FkbM family methyltransferase